MRKNFREKISKYDDYIGDKPIEIQRRSINISIDEPIEAAIKLSLHFSDIPDKNRNVRICIGSDIGE